MSKKEAFRMINIFFDMDGTLVNTYKGFKGDVSVFEKRRFFQDLEPKTYRRKKDNLIKFFTDLYELAEFANLEDEITLHTLTAVPTEHGIIEKILWTGEHAKGVFTADTIHIVPIGTNKAEYVKGLLGGMLLPTDILLDDYGKNLKEWHEAGGTSVKIYPTTNKVRKGETVKNLEEFVDWFGNFLYDIKHGVLFA
jgi:hydroxymethylpyrimidine pyrophosphatase-like HAD family hydrolase